jgi:hypothetical protein
MRIERRREDNPKLEPQTAVMIRISATVNDAISPGKDAGRYEVCKKEEIK